VLRRPPGTDAGPTTADPVARRGPGVLAPPHSKGSIPRRSRENPEPKVDRLPEVGSQLRKHFAK